MPDSETGAGALQSCRLSREAGTTSQSAAWQTLVSGLQNGVAPAQFMHSMDSASHQLGNRAFMHWVGALQAGGVDVADRDAVAHNAPAAPLQLMPKKRKQKTQAAQSPEALQEEPPENVAATLETPAEPGAGVGPEPEETSLQAGPEGAAVAKKKKKKKKSRVQVALNTLRADGVETFQRYIEAEVGETGLLRDLTERINRAEDLENVRDAALGFVAMRLRASEREAGTAMQQAAGPGQGEIAETAVIAPMKLTLSYREQGLVDSCIKGDVYKLRHLLKFGSIDINMGTPWGTLLSPAAFYGHTAIARELLSIPATDVNLAQWKGATPLFLAAQQGHVDLVRLLLAAHGINPNLGMLGQKTTPLIIAAYKGHEEVVKILLTASSVRINLRQADGSTALFAATQANFPGIVEALARRGADVNLTLFDGTLPLCHAAFKGNIEVLKRLLQAPGIQIDDKSGKRVTALFCAAQEGQKEAVELLLAKGADPDMADENRVGPLHIACLYGRTEFVELLLNAGADMELKAEQEYTCYEVAKIGGHQEIMRLIEERRPDREARQARIEELSPCLRPAEPAPLLTTGRARPPAYDRQSPPLRKQGGRLCESRGAGSAKAGGQALQDRPQQTGPLSQADTVPAAQPALLPDSGVGSKPEPAGTEQGEAASAASPDAAPDSPTRSTKPQSPLERAKTEFIGTVLEKLRNDWLDPLDGIRLLEQVNTVADLDGLCVIFNRLAGIERNKFRSGRRQLWRGVPAAEAAPADAGPSGFALGERQGLDAEAVEDEIKQHLAQPYHRFVSQAVNDMEFGRGKLTSGYPGLLHVSAGVAGAGSCSIFFYPKDEGKQIRIVGLGHHLDRRTYRLDYATAELQGLRTIRLN